MEKLLEKIMRYLIGVDHSSTIEVAGWEIIQYLKQINYQPTLYNERKLNYE
jgi:hypothetical protein